MSHFDPHHKYPAACINAVGLDASSIGTLLLSLSTIAGTEISNPSWVNFQSAGWVSFQSAPTGCTKAGRCDSFLLGDYIECLTCEGAIIKRSNLDAAIEDATEELCNYPENSGEYQIVKGDIERLTAYKARLIDTVELSL